MSPSTPKSESARLTHPKFEKTTRMKMLFKIPITLAAFMVVLQATQTQAAVVLVDGSVAGNLPEVLQANVRAGMYGNEAYFEPNEWDRSLYSFTLSATDDNGNPIPITRVDNLTVTLSSNTSATTVVFNVATVVAGGLKFNVEGLGAPVINAYNQAGTNVTGSSGLIGQAIVGNDLTAEDIWSITFSDLRVQDTPTATAGGAFNISLTGHEAYAVVDATIIAGGTSVSGTDQMRSIIGSPVPEPSSMFLAVAGSLGCIMRRRR